MIFRYVIVAHFWKQYEGEFKSSFIFGSENGLPKNRSFVPLFSSPPSGPYRIFVATTGVTSPGFVLLSKVYTKNFAVAWRFVVPFLATPWETMPDLWANYPEAWVSCPKGWERMPKAWESIPRPWARLPKPWENIPKRWAICPELWESLLKDYPYFPEVWGGSGSLRGNRTKVQESWTKVWSIEHLPPDRYPFP